ncbi:early endosome antigen 1-like [Antennarius striatus]|uniref:early endosome antigen 1-like n=1 Tax=Antennarius striatus TaxID=241820 RepID=UPI0035B303C0
MKRSVNHAKQNQFELQEQLSEANNKISEAYLEKAILSTQVLKLEDDIKDLRTKLTGPGKDLPIQHNADLHVEAQEAAMSCSEVKEKLEMITQELNTSQSQLHHVTAAGVIGSRQIQDLETQCIQLSSEKEELRKMNEGQHYELTAMTEKCCQLRKSLEFFELQKQTLQDQCLCLEAAALEKEEMLRRQKEEHQRQEAVHVKSTEELKAVAIHWFEKWQEVALALQFAQEEQEELKKSNCRNENELGQLMETELDTGEQELGLEMSQSQELLHTYERKGDALSVQTQVKETDISPSSLSWKSKRRREEEMSVPCSSHNKADQRFMQSSDTETQRKLADRDKEVLEKEEALKCLGRLRKVEMDETQFQIPALEFQASENYKDTESQIKISTINSLKAQLEESKRRMNQLQEEKTVAIQKLQALRKHYQQDWTCMNKDMKSGVDRRSWQRGSDLMPVFEEDEENSDWSGGEEERPAEEHVYNQSRQMPNMSVGINCLEAMNSNLIQATLRCNQPVQDCPPTADKHEPPTAEVPDLYDCLNDDDLQKMKALSLYPDGIFLAEVIEICSPDENEEEGDAK